MKNEICNTWTKRTAQLIVVFAILLGIVDLDISPFTFGKAIYWSRLAYGRLSTHAHPPFGITYKDDKYLTDDDWEVEGVTVPGGSQIVKVNGTSCSDYLDFIKENTPLRYDAYLKDWTKNYLLIIDEGEDFKGWQVDFLLPDKSIHNAFVPKIKGFPAPKKERIQIVEGKDNCTCIELTDEVAYIRIKSIMPIMNAWGAIFPSIYRKEGKMIKTFLDNANGKYRIIIDVRNNGGGIPYYVYENLVSPFLDESVTYDEVMGLRRKYRDNLTKSNLKTLRKMVSGKKEHVVNTEEIDAPEDFDSRDWVFYRITRRIEPRNRYNFDGSVYVLIDRPTFSAADSYANTVKRIGFARLVGLNTGGGCAAYIAPPVIRLPASVMIFRVETELYINPDGSVNALFGTPPDPNTFTRFKPAWEKYIGTYKYIMSGWKFDTIVNIGLALGLTASNLHVKVFEEDGYLYVDSFVLGNDSRDRDGGRLDEYLPGLFFTPSGKCLDLRGPELRWNNYRIKKVDNDNNRNFDLN